MDTEGLMLLENSIDYDFECKFYNPDGSTGMMCGNGGRAIVRFAYELNHIEQTQENVIFYMADDIYKARKTNENIDLTMSEVKFETDKTLTIDNKQINTYYVDNGSQHVVINIEEFDINDLNSLNVLDLGKKVRFNKVLEPRGANANFYYNVGNLIKLRTYERGVEKETGACGTGAVATAIAAHNNLNIDYPITIIPTSQDILKIDKEMIDDIAIYHLIGPAKIINQNKLEIE
jgi:diaminopimelate epimerase